MKETVITINHSEYCRTHIQVKARHVMVVERVYLCFKITLYFWALLGDPDNSISCSGMLKRAQWICLQILRLSFTNNNKASERQNCEAGRHALFFATPCFPWRQPDAFQMPGTFSWPKHWNEVAMPAPTAPHIALSYNHLSVHLATLSTRLWTSFFLFFN